MPVNKMSALVYFMQVRLSINSSEDLYYFQVEVVAMSLPVLLQLPERLVFA